MKLLNAKEVYERINQLPPDKQMLALQKLREVQEKYKFSARELFDPYAKQIQFITAGKDYRERLFCAGNQLGKTLTGGYEVSYHLTGYYPEGWTGRVFDKGVKTWVAGESGESTRDNPQRILMGDIEDEIGTGMIPKSAIIDVKPARGVAGLLDTVVVEHENRKKVSMLQFKSYGKGREKWQGVTLHLVWFDEEPPLDVYNEGVTRTNYHMGPILVTFTPLKGMSTVVLRFLEPEDGAPPRHVTTMTIDDVDHYTEKEKQQIVATYAEHEREARANGAPMLGSGRIFPVSEEAIKVDPFPIPAWWGKICAIDFGIDHPFSCCWLAHDTEADTVYVVDEYRIRGVTPITHAAAIKTRAIQPIAWPADGLQTEKGSGKQLKRLYTEQGLTLLGESAHYADDRRNFVEPGLMDMLQRMETGRWKVFKSCGQWLDEFRTYHRKEGKVVKERDDLIDASRYGLMMLRYAQKGELFVPKRDRWDRAFDDDNYSGDGNWKTL